MKTKFQTLKNILLVGLVTLTSLSISHSQVITRVLSPGDKIENYIPWYNPEDRSPVVNAPRVDVEAVLEQDRISGREMPRIGIKQEVNFTAKDGQLVRRGNYSIWNMTVQSQNAKSLSIRFDDTYLPQNAIMFLYNEKSRFVVGPIKQEVFQSGTFRSDYLNGDFVSISLFMPRSDEFKAPEINIITYDYGIIPFRSYDDYFDASEPCNINTSCPEGNGWECQINSVCKIIHSSIGSCTGSLINNDCCDLTPYILTAGHCVAGFPVDDYLYRFNYESPQCTPNGETPPWWWITYFGSELRANWSGTDFGLVELTQNFETDRDMAFAGWDRSPQVPPNSTFIHHPSGDVKKITYDNGLSTQSGNFYNFNLTPGMNGDFGTLEGGSSGCPKYNSSQRIIGQQSGGLPHRILCSTTFSNNDDGRLDRSWNGSGTNSTRLSNWLGASTNPNTMDCMDSPYVLGPEVLCTNPETYTLINNMPCAKSVTWRVEPANLFGSPTTGNGTTAVLWGKAGYSGHATLIYSLSATGCNDVEVEYDIFVGRPCTFELYSFPTEICVGERGWTFLNLFDDCFDNYNSIEWNFFGAISGYGSNQKGKYRGTRTGYGYVCVTITNDCGSREVCDQIYVKDCDGDVRGKRSANTKTENNEELKLSLSPNPTTQTTYLSLNNDLDINTHIWIIDLNGKLILELESNEKIIPLDLAEIANGIYIVQCQIGDKIIYKKLVKS